ncbi:MAG TPA: CapA family protein [Candidatus Acidoferrum sp.]|jgi:hypothetical protein
MSKPNQGMAIWTQSDDAVFRVAIAGDFLPAETVSPASGKTWESEAEIVSRYFEDVDTSLVNLECPVNVGLNPPRAKLGLGATFAGSAESLDYLVALKAEVASVANNHVYDYADPGVGSTVHCLAKRNINAIGYGRSLAESPSIHVRKTPSNFSIGFWAAARGLPELSTIKSIGIEPATLKRGQQAVVALESAGCSIKIALLHTGLEHTNYPDPDDVRLMDELAAEGFDVVAACHSHRTSGYRLIRRSNGKMAFCFYGLGSLTSCIAYSPLEREGLVLVVHANSSGTICAVDLRPVFLSPTGWATVPEPHQAKTILDRVQSISTEISGGSYAERFYADTSKNFFSRQWRDVKVAFKHGGLTGIAQKFSRIRGRHLRRFLHKLWGPVSGSSLPSSPVQKQL